jgi:hypothetical protein
MARVYLDDRNYLEKITELWIFASSDKDGEGIIGETFNVMGQATFMPFVCADKARMESLKPLAKRIAKESGKKVKLVRLSVREEIEEY